MGGEMRRIMFAAFLFCFIQTYAKTPIPEALLNAKTAVVINQGSDAKDFEKFCTLLSEWGRFELVPDSGKADIIIRLSTKLEIKTVQMPSTAGGLGGMNTQQVIVSTVNITNARDGSQLWTGETPSKNPKNLVSDLKNKLKTK
jgi:hypothetical protein